MGGGGGGTPKSGRTQVRGKGPRIFFEKNPRLFVSWARGRVYPRGTRRWKRPRIFAVFSQNYPKPNQGAHGGKRRPFPGWFTGTDKVCIEERFLRGRKNPEFPKKPFIKKSKSPPTRFFPEKNKTGKKAGGGGTVRDLVSLSDFLSGQKQQTKPGGTAGPPNQKKKLSSGWGDPHQGKSNHLPTNQGGLGRFRD